MIYTLPNFISFLRLPLALVFLQENTTFRLLALIIAMISDGLDGYLARKYQQKSRFGTFLDPFADKVFVIIALTVFVSEQRLELWQVFSMLGRDFAVLIFGCYLFLKGTLGVYQFRAIWCGKITTAFQFLLLIGLTLGFHIPSIYYSVFVVLGIAALGELYISREKLKLE